jgi:hypothetical protein
MLDLETVVRGIVTTYWKNYSPFIIENYVQRHVFEVRLLKDWLGDH